jgi:putative methyltransferase (TIGR04325 family)
MREMIDRQKAIEFLKNWLPPGLISILRGISGIRWSGDYSSWDEARKASTGYDDEIILRRVADSMLKVKSGEAIYERDSVLFGEIQYSWPLLAGLMWIAARNKGELNIIDFGGSLGSTFFQNKTFLQGLPKVRWNIIEQKGFVDIGKKHFEDETLKFYYDIESCLRETSPSAIIMSSVIQYMEKPYDILEAIKMLGFDYFIFDRIPLSIKGRDRLTIQKVPPEIYPATYPCWFFHKERFYAFLKDKYSLIAGFESVDRANIPSTFEGSIWRKKQMMCVGGQ